MWSQFIDIKRNSTLHSLYILHLTQNALGLEFQPLRTLSCQLTLSPSTVLMCASASSGGAESVPDE